MENRQLSHDLHPLTLQDAGLPQALHAYCEEFSSASGIPVACEADEGDDESSPGAALALFRILQEARGNATKYSSQGGRGSPEAIRRLRLVGGVGLGLGFERSELGTSPGLGLITMRERCSIEWDLDFDSAPGRGTTISVVIPFR
jgi:signal transduction histidine kinase